jgi:MoxR-like ATPase
MAESELAADRQRPVESAVPWSADPVRSRAVDPLRPHAEEQYADELAALRRADDRPRPPRWWLSPWAVVTYLLGGELPDGTTITPKYVGSRRMIEVAVATLATDRALLLLGVPGTAKSWVSEHLAAAISGDSTLLVQGTAGTAEEAIRYGWNYARLLAEGPSEQALVPSPVMTAMRRGSLVRIEELTRIPADVQDALIMVLSEKALPVPELGLETQALKGFNLIATANDRDKGVNELSSALRRRFNTVVLPLPESEEDEVRIVATRVADLSAALELPAVPAAIDEIRRVVNVFRELRSGVTKDGRTKVKVPSGTLSTAEAISVITNGMALSAHFGNGELSPGDVAAGIVGAVIKDPIADRVAWNEYLEVVVRERPGWSAFYTACREVS